MAVEPEYGAEVTDKNGKVLGTIDHLMHNTWTGELSKFIVRRQAPETDLFISVEDVSEIKGNKVKLNVPLEELEQR